MLSGCCCSLRANSSKLVISQKSAFDLDSQRGTLQKQTAMTVGLHSMMKFPSSSRRKTDSYGMTCHRIFRLYVTFAVNRIGLSEVINGDDGLRRQSRRSRTNRRREGRSTCDSE